jgi:hypothetical protein
MTRNQRLNACAGSDAFPPQARAWQPLSQCARSERHVPRSQTLAWDEPQVSVSTDSGAGSPLFVWHTQQRGRPEARGAGAEGLVADRRETAPVVVRAIRGGEGGIRTHEAV